MILCNMKVSVSAKKKEQCHIIIHVRVYENKILDPYSKELKGKGTDLSILGILITYVSSFIFYIDLHFAP